MKKSIMVAALFGCAIALLGVSCANESKNDSSANVSTGKDETNTSETDKNETDKNKDESDDDKNGDDKTWKEVTKFSSGDYKGTFWRGDGEMALKAGLEREIYEEYEDVFEDLKLPVKMTLDFKEGKVCEKKEIDVTKIVKAIAKADNKKESDVWNDNVYKNLICDASKNDPWLKFEEEYTYSDLNESLRKLEEEKEKYSKKKRYEYYINSNKTQLKYVAYMPDPDLDYNYTDVVAEEIILKKL